MVLDQIKKILVETMDIEEEKITLDAKLKDDLNLDILIDNIKKFNSSLDNLELSQQRLLLSSIIKNVIWIRMHFSL